MANELMVFVLVKLRHRFDDSSLPDNPTALFASIVMSLDARRPAAFSSRLDGIRINGSLAEQPACGVDLKLAHRLRLNLDEEAADYLLFLLRIALPFQRFQEHLRRVPHLPPFFQSQFLEINAKLLRLALA